MIKHLILLKTQNTIDIKVDTLQWFINFFIKKVLVEQSKMKIFLIKNQLKSYANQLLENIKKLNYTHFL